MKKILGAVLLVAACSSVVAADDDEWIEYATTPTDKFYLKKGTGEVINNKSGEEVFMAIHKNLDMKKKEISFRKVYVRQKDCESGAGKVVFLYVGGNFDDEVDFVLGGGSVGSTLAEYLCSTYESVKREEQEKSI